MKVLVTGSAGFIGAATMRALEAKDFEGVRFDKADGDIRDEDAVNRAVKGCDAVIHLAGVLGTHELFDTPQEAVDVNVKGTLNVLQACVASDARYVGITMPPVFKSIYTATKIAGARLASAYQANFDLPVSHVRAFNAYGIGQKYGAGHPQKIVPTFATMAWRNEPLPVWGDGSQTVDLVHVADLGRMLVEALRFGNDVTLDGGTKRAMSVNYVAELVIRITGSRSEIRHLPMRRGEVPTNIAAEGEGWSLLGGWHPTWSEVKFQETLAWYF